MTAQHTFFSLGNDSISFPNTSNKLTLVYFTNKSCYDCFFYLNDYFKSDSSINYYFIIEKIPSAIGNYEVYKNLIKRGIDKNRVFFTKIITQEISPFVKIYKNETEIYIPYREVFEKKETIELSRKLRAALHN